MDNKLHVIETNSTFSNYKNEASIINFTLGLSRRIPTSSTFDLFYGFGINFVSIYDLMITFSTKSYYTSDLEAIDLALGFNFKQKLNSINLFL